jgi:hypothetical protein
MANVPELPAGNTVLGGRIDAFVKRWCWVFERTTAIRRAANLSEPFSPEIKRRHAWARKRRSLDLETLFKTELSQLAAKDRAELLDAASAALDWPTWEHLRAHRKLSVARATRVMTRMLTAILSEKF